TRSPLMLQPTTPKLFFSLLLLYQLVVQSAVTYISITKYPNYLINLVISEFAVNISLLWRFILEIIILVIQNSIYMGALLPTNNIIIAETQNTVKPLG
ncbi:MAG: hypothetical protein ACLBM4_17470, partial [Dolichospermum sp.]